MFVRSLIVAAALAAGPAVAEVIGEPVDCARLQVAAAWQASPSWNVPRFAQPGQRFAFAQGDRMQSRTRSSMTLLRADGKKVKVECQCGASSSGCVLKTDPIAAWCEASGCTKSCTIKTTIPQSTGYQPFYQAPSRGGVFWR